MEPVPGAALVRPRRRCLELITQQKQLRDEGWTSREVEPFERAATLEDGSSGLPEGAVPGRAGPLSPG